MEFRILGPLEVAAGTDRLELHGTRQQIVVAMLLLSANRVVTMDRLLEAIYGEDLPPTARSQAQISISSLRRMFASRSTPSRSADSLIATHAHGYVLQVRDGELDSDRFDELVAAARQARESNDLNLAVAKYRDAVRLWRGPALDGIESHLVRAAASRLDEQRISTNEDRIALELTLGRHHELVGELAELVEEYPLRERLRGQLMLCLYRCDRAAEALQAYQNARRTMIDELGIEPSDRLQQLQHSILTSDPGLDPPSRQQPQQAPTVQPPPKQQAPNLLPADIADFTGRSEQVKRIHEHLIHTGEEVRLAVPVVVVVGRGGVGKTTLAVHASHGLADHFPDGQLFADLHGGGGSHPVSSMQVLERFLRALGVPGTQIPEDNDERAEVYRNLLADRRVLVVLDDVASESQVLPLLPGSSTAGVVMTSRSRLAGLAGALRVEVKVLDAGKSVDLLASIAGVERVEAQAEEAAAVARLCGHLPLALRIAGARLAARPHWSVQQLVDRLADETRRLDELRHGEMGIRPSISLTYDSTGEDARRLFRRLAMLDMPVFSGWLGAALLDESIATAENLLDDLVTAQLIETEGDSGLDSRYRFHDLVRVFARERLAAEESVTERRGALERALGALLHVAEEARRRYYGGDYIQIDSGTRRWPLPGHTVEMLVADPLAWYDRERIALVSGVRQAAQAGLTELCWNLASSAVVLFEARVYLDDWRETHEVALDAARKAHDIRGQAVILYQAGELHLAQVQLDQALKEFTAAIRLFEDAGDDHGIAIVKRNIATIDRLSGRLDDAARHCEQALTIFRKAADPVATAWVLHGLAEVRLEQNKFTEAMELLSDALDLCQAAPGVRIEALILHRMGEACLMAGDLARAADTFEQAQAITRDMGDLIGQAYALAGLGVAKARQGEYEQARDVLRRALDLASEMGERMAEARARLGLGELELAIGNPGQAVELGRLAAAGFQGMDAPLYEARALTLLSDAQAALGDSEAAQTAAVQAATLRMKLTGDDAATS